MSPLVKAIIFLAVVVCCLQCKSNKEVSYTKDKPAMVIFVDSIQAAQNIIDDDVDGFFDQCSKLEMEIQMKKNSPFTTRDEALIAYKQFLRGQVSSWTTEEKLAMLELFKLAKNRCDQLSPALFPDGIKLVKIKTGHYGNDVYYTRGKNIMVPENILSDLQTALHLPIMTHEIFHILSRYRENLRNDMYGFIGFKKSNKPIRINETLSKVLLTNPDGVSFQYIIELEVDGKSQLVVPLITSKFRQFKTSNPKFFDYLNFDLYALEDRGSYYEITSDHQGKTTLPINNTPAFFTKIKDNTQYIIHPDEIMADNFMLALQAVEKKEFTKFSKEGKVLIDKVIQRLQQE